MARQCYNYQQNLENCSCTYPGCPRKGNCCECLQYHLAQQELPACAFPPEIAKTYERSFAKFVTIHKDLL